MLSHQYDDGSNKTPTEPLNTMDNTLPNPFATQLPFIIQNPLGDPFAPALESYVDTFSPPPPDHSLSALPVVPILNTFAVPAAPVIKPVKFQMAVWPELWR
jgi:hypothetical protein